MLFVEFPHFHFAVEDCFHWDQEDRKAQARQSLPLRPCAAEAVSGCSAGHMSLSPAISPVHLPPLGADMTGSNIGGPSRPVHPLGEYHTVTPIGPTCTRALLSQAPLRLLPMELRDNRLHQAVEFGEVSCVVMDNWDFLMEAVTLLQTFFSLNLGNVAFSGLLPPPWQHLLPYLSLKSATSGFLLGAPTL